MLSRIWHVFTARNKEFFYDKASLGWNLLFPFFVLIALYVILSGGPRPLFKVGFLGPDATSNMSQVPLFLEKNIDFVPFESRDKALFQLKRHQLDLVIEWDQEIRYWINPLSQGSHFAEKVMIATETQAQSRLKRFEVENDELRYIDWVFPGVLAMNVMWSCLFGVGYVLVNYRRTGYLRRLHATPLRAFEFLSAQLFSRYLISFVASAIVYFGCLSFLGFRMQGSYIDLFVVFSLGLLALCAVGLLVASRTASKELADGLLNLYSWPMMFLSEVWFSIDGAPQVVRVFGEFFPLTPMVRAMRAIMNDGASLLEVWPDCLALCAMILVGVGLGSVLFRWDQK